MVTSKNRAPLRKFLIQIFVHWIIYFFIIGILLLLTVNAVYSQAEVAPWGNINGLRVEGQLVGFESSLCLVEKDWSQIKATGRERQRPKYIRDGNKQVINTKIDSITFKEVVEDIESGTANVDVRLSSNSSVTLEGVFFRIVLPLEEYTTAIVHSNKKFATKTQLATLQHDVTYTAGNIQFTSHTRTLIFTFDAPTSVIIKKNSGYCK